MIMGSLGKVIFLEQTAVPEKTRKECAASGVLCTIRNVIRSSKVTDAVSNLKVDVMTNGHGSSDADAIPRSLLATRVR
jgi:hypothetical protein